MLCFVFVLFCQLYDESGEEENAQLCVYVGNKLVVDIWGCRDESNPIGYGPDSLQVYLFQL